MKSLSRRISWKVTISSPVNPAKPSAVSMPVVEHDRCIDTFATTENVFLNGSLITRLEVIKAHDIIESWIKGNGINHYNFPFGDNTN